jgi:hypothetical protein
MLSRVRGSVLDMTDKRQVPWDSSSLTGDFYFNLTVNIDAREERKPVPPPGPAFDRDSLFWQSVQASDDPADLEAYLARFPDGIYAALARNRLTRLQAQQRQAALPPATAGIPAADRRRARAAPRCPRGVARGGRGGARPLTRGLAGAAGGR